MQKRVWWWLELVVYMGLMLSNPSITSQIRPWAHFIPTVVVFAVDGLSILSSIYSTKSTVKIWDLVDPKMDGAPHLIQSVESNRRFAHYCGWKLNSREESCLVNSRSKGGWFYCTISLQWLLYWTADKQISACDPYRWKDQCYFTNLQKCTESLVRYSLAICCGSLTAGNSSTLWELTIYELGKCRKNGFLYIFFVQWKYKTLLTL